ncbi:hypothetical protein M419DRAFT_118135 [Trichoderma reesei RUT C-30]|uniref:Uncharacterized protein n=1 Tax=Hypocrea jecorina (strain ATCC 56765 / BCRC 32924 / NRRL 11460 / Rut C-30) TaxID=1344414 RepID=A0A024SET8_HYPJR|nr:hypothetical protein M419DRAFT_118135 [Trichoderma reesei RUT C-30]
MPRRTSDPNEAPLRCFHHLDRLLPNEAAECLMFSLLSAVRITSPAGPMGARERVSLEKQAKQANLGRCYATPCFVRHDPLITAEILRRQPCRDRARQGAYE